MIIMILITLMRVGQGLPLPNRPRKPPVRAPKGETVTAADPTLHTLVERLRRLEEMEIARNHLHRYAATLDNPTPEAVAALFTDDGILRTGRGTAVGRTSIADFYRRLLERDPSEKRHFITSPHTTWLAPGLVEIASYFLFTGRGTNRSVLGWGTYLDRIRIVDGTP